MGIFGNLFDFNRDGELDAAERAAELSFVAHLLENEDNYTRGLTVFGQASLRFLISGYGRCRRRRPASPPRLR